VLNLFAEDSLNYHTAVAGGMLAEECGRVLKSFFQKRRGANGQ